MSGQVRALVSSQWLSNAVKCDILSPKLRVLDTSWYLPAWKRDAKAEFAREHIPGSQYFDIDECSDKSSVYEHMLPTSRNFSQYVGDLGIGNDTHVVVYDTSDFGSYIAPRAWWMFRLFGHSAVSVLDGGLKNWVSESHPVTSEMRTPMRREFKAAMNPSWVKSYEEVLENISSKKAQVVDTRFNGMFRGTEPEIRKDLLPGHFPGAVNIPFTSFLDSSGKELDKETLLKLFKDTGIDLQRPLWATCTTGVTACHVALAAYLLGYPGVCVYDGSWSEWFVRASPQHIISEGQKKKG